MKSNKNIEEFFKKRLEQDIPSADGWNIPSDDIWTKAKVSFPKEKKKNRSFFYFISGVSILIAFSAYFLVNHFNGKKLLVHDKVDITKVDQINEIENAENKNKSNKIISTKEIDETATSNNNNKDITRTLNELTKSPFSENKAKKTEGVFAQTLTRSGKNQEVTKSKIAFSEIKSKSNVGNAELVKSSMRTLSKDEIEKQRPSMTEESKLILPVINLETTALNELSFPEKELDKKVFVNKYKGLARAKNLELGISTSSFVIPVRMLRGIDLVSDNDTFNLNIEYQNINASISKRFSHRWSVSTGVMFTKASILGNVTDQDLIEDQMGLDFRLSSNINIGSITINDSQRDINTTYTPGKEPTIGDEITVKAEMPLDIQLVQIPLFLNYHLKRKNNMEWILHTGIALDLFRVRINYFDLEIFNEGELISQPLNDFDPIEERDIGLSLFVGGGFKYHLNQNWNLGLSSRFDVFSLALARYEFGVYRRF